MDDEVSSVRRRSYKGHVSPDKEGDEQTRDSNRCQDTAGQTVNSRRRTHGEKPNSTRSPMVWTLIGLVTHLCITLLILSVAFAVYKFYITAQTAEKNSDDIAILNKKAEQLAEFQVKIMREVQQLEEKVKKLRDGLVDLAQIVEKLSDKVETYSSKHERAIQVNQHNSGYGIGYAIGSLITSLLSKLFGLF